MIRRIYTRLIDESLALEQRLTNKINSQSTISRFVIICNIRSGSTMLQNLLNSHPNIRCFFELFHRDKSSVPFSISGYRQKSKDPKIVQLRNNEPVPFLRKYIWGCHPKRIKSAGFKLLYSQARKEPQWWESPTYEFWWKEVGIEPRWAPNSEDLWGYLAGENIHIIHLIRENLLESKISSLVAQKTGNWGIGASGGISDNTFSGSFFLDPVELRLDFEGEEKFRSEARNRFSNNPYLETSYEKLINNGAAELNQIQQFLNVPSYPLKTKTKKQANYQLRQIISNYDQLKKEFTETPFEQFFSD